VTVGELQKRLAKFPPDTTVVVYWEEGSDSHFAVDDVSLKTGNPSRGTDGKPRFKFSQAGPATWAFIEISPE